MLSSPCLDNYNWVCLSVCVCAVCAVYACGICMVHESMVH